MKPEPIRKRRTALLAALFAGALCTFGQATTDYDELPNPTATDPKAWSAVKSVTVGWGDTDTRYKKELPAGTTARSISLTAWRGEKVSAQLAVSTPEKLSALTFEADDLNNKQGKRADGIREICNGGRTAEGRTEHMQRPQPG